MRIVEEVGIILTIIITLTLIICKRQSAEMHLIRERDLN